MKKFLLFILAAAIMISAGIIGSFAEPISDDTDESLDMQLYSVNAVESEEDELPDEQPVGNSNLISEDEVAGTEAENVTEEASAPSVNPNTGVAIAIIPAVIALAVLIILFILSRSKKKK